MTILIHDVGLDSESVVHVSHVAQMKGRAADRLHRNIVELRNRPRRAVHADVVFPYANLCRAAWQRDVLRVDDIHDVLRRESVRQQFLRIDIDHDLPHFAAVGQRQSSALNCRQLRTNEVRRVVVQLLLAEILSTQADLEDGNR